MHYGKLAFEFLNGPLDYSDHYSYRWTIISFTALSYYLFGVSDFSTALPALFLSSTMLLVMYWQFRKKPLILAFVYILFFAIKWNVFYTDKIMPDIYVSCFLFLAWSVYLKFDDKKQYLKSFLFPFLLFLAFISKGTVILFLPLILYYLILDLFKGKFKKWMYISVAGFIILGGYMISINTLTGDFLSRFTAIESNQYFNACSYDQMPFSETLKRLTFDFAKLIWEHSLIVFLAFSVGAKLYAYFGSLPIKNQKQIHWYSNTIIVLFLSMNFMTISLKSYNPTCLDIRHFIFVVPIMAVCSAYILDALHLNMKAKRIVLLLSCVLLIPTINQLKYSKSLKYPENKKDLMNLVEVLQSTDQHIISNTVMINLLNHYSSYKLKERLHIPSEFEINDMPKNVWLLSSWYTEYHSSSNLNELIENLGIEKEELIKSNDYSSNTIEVFRLKR